MYLPAINSSATYGVLLTCSAFSGEALRGGIVDLILLALFLDSVAGCCL